MSPDSDVLENRHTHSERELTILYATETGTAQDVAERLARHCRRLHFVPRVFNMDEYDLEEIISETFVIFVIATTGNGKEPRSMTPFWTTLLRSDLPEDLFEDLEFAVFGLGDTAYEKFCWPAKLLSRRLASLGAKEVCERGEGDDQHQLGVDGAFSPWLSELSSTLLELFPFPPGVDTLPENTLPAPRVSIASSPTPNGAAKPSKHPNLDPRFGDKQYHLATLTCNERITAQDWFQDVRHLEFEFDEDVQYEPGDVAIIHPEVPPSQVDSFLISFGCANIADEEFTIEHALPDQSLPRHLPRVLTLRELFTRYLDISAVPRRSFFSWLRHFVSDEMEKEKIDEFLSSEGADELYEYTQRVKRSIREVLEEFRSAKIPREYVFDVFPPLRPREFSIASSVRQHPRKVQLCVAIVQYRTRLRIPRRGVTTTYLSTLQPGDKILLGIKPGGLIKLPKDIDTPVICIGPGTGIAPVRAIIEDRVTLGTSQNTVYQGCRSGTKDQHYQTYFSQLASSSPPPPSLPSAPLENDTNTNEHPNPNSDQLEPQLTYRVARSRDGPEGTKRTYVQDLILEDSEKVWEDIDVKNGCVYISGSSNKMPAGIRAALREIAIKHAGLSEEEAGEYVVRMEREGRLIEDCWS